MPDITVQRHGDRWSVLEAGAESPTKEFETREAAEMEARHLAAGGEVSVVEDDPSGLQEAPTETDPLDAPRVGRIDADDISQTLQTGL